MGLHLENEVVKTPTITPNNPIYIYIYTHTHTHIHGPKSFMAFLD